MTWENPYVVHGARLKDDAHIRGEADRYRARLEGLAAAARETV
jgi:glutathione-regulated potassium-efflux system ancillary protein KefG